MDAAEKQFREGCRIITNIYTALMCLAYSILHNREDSEDVVQQACELFLVHIANVKNPAAWLYTTVKNLACHLKKSRGKVVSLDKFHNLSSKLLDPSDKVLDENSRNVVHNAISLLDDKYRNAVHLFYFDGKSVKEAAKLLGISEGTFLSRLHRARRLLYGLLAGYRKDVLG